MSVYSSPFQLLEINLISAQDLFPVSKPIRAYAVTWLHPERKLTTRTDITGNTNPTWNEKFVFRVDEQFLNSETSAIMIEIYATAWLRDVLIGTVGVLISNLVPPAVREGNRKSKLRFVALQIRRPSGRPQGILNIGVTMLDSSMRSMPLYSKLSASAVGYWDLMEDKKTNKSTVKTNQTPQHSNLLALQRSQSEKNDSTIDDDFNYNIWELGKQGGCGGSACSASEGSELIIAKPQKKIVNANGSLCSDVGPSPSVVAAAIAKGLYPIPMRPVLPAASGTSGSSPLEEWTENNSTEGLKTKIERWNSGLLPEYGHVVESYSYRMPNKTPNSKRVGRTPGRPTPTNRRNNGLFSCFGAALGCEFSISFGSGNNRKKKRSKGKHLPASDLTYDRSYI